MYLQRYLEDQANGKTYPTFIDGLKALATCAEVTQSMQTWLTDAVWMSKTLHFSTSIVPFLPTLCTERTAAHAGFSFI